MKATIQLYRRNLLLGLLGLLIAAIVGATLSLVKQVSDQGWVERTLSERSLLLHTLSTLRDAETNQRGFLLSGDESFLGPYNAATRQIHSDLEALGEALADNPAQMLRLNRLRSITGARMSALRERIDERWRAPASVSIDKFKLGSRLMDDAREMIQGMIDQEEQVLIVQAASARWTSIGAEAGVLTSLILAVLLGWAIQQESHREMRQLRDVNVALEEALAVANQESERRLRLEHQLRQSQKMEAVGQLTGGIAHDFNNMLAVIVGCLNLVKVKMSRSEPDAGRFVDKAMDGAERAAALTHRLLAFSRQQPLMPQTICLNGLVAGMSEVIHRTLGDIRVETVLASGLWQTRVDPNQLENALLNLAVNARDAMPEGGRLTIETGNAYIDDDYALEHVEVLPGQYVLLAITDTGTGMPPSVIAKAFDPFFTTKGLGKGTGLGLSQVYGFVKQSGGHIKIYSELAQGTTIKIYLPRFTGSSEAVRPNYQRSVSATSLQSRAEELVLVVEDEARMRSVSVAMLQDLGYRVLAAGSGVEALALIDAYPGLALLFTDVVMPDMNGRALAEEAWRRRPDLKVLFTTGFSRNAVIHNGVLDAGVHFLPKPFTLEQLGQKVLSVLQSEFAP